jgi:hypothetical protein
VVASFPFSFVVVMMAAVVAVVVVVESSLPISPSKLLLDFGLFFLGHVDCKGVQDFVAKADEA